MEFDHSSCNFTAGIRHEPFSWSILEIQNYPEEYDELFNEIGAEIRERRFLKKSDISALAAWKRLDLSTEWMKNLQSMSDVALRDLSKNIFDSDLGVHERISNSAKSGIPGFGGTFSVASTVLAAFDPYDFGITDRRSRDSLIRLGCSCGDALKRYSKYLGHLHYLRDYFNDNVEKSSLTSRHIDKVLYAQSSQLVSVFIK